MQVDRHSPATEMHAIRRQEVQCSASCADCGTDGQSTKSARPLSPIPTFCKPSSASHRPFDLKTCPRSPPAPAHTPLLPLCTSQGQVCVAAQPTGALGEQVTLLPVDRAAQLPTLPLPGPALSAPAEQQQQPARCPQPRRQPGPRQPSRPTRQAAAAARRPTPTCPKRC